MKRYLTALLACLPLAAGAAAGISKLNGSIRVTADHPVGDVDSVNGSIQVEAGATVGDVETVNGRIELAEHTTAGNLESVNGSVRLGTQAKASSINTVNGALRFGEGVRIAGDVCAVNGTVSLAKGSDVGGRLSNVNGKITLESSRVGGRLETVNGDIAVGPGSRVEGGILVGKRPYTVGTRRVPRIVIGPDAVIAGPLEFKRKVELYVSTRAQIGPVTGATPIPFSGSDPDETTRK